MSQAIFTQVKHSTLYNHYPDDDFYPGLWLGGAVVAYASRAYVLTHPNDSIILPPSLKPYYPFISEHYKRIGLSVTDQIAWTQSVLEAYEQYSHYAYDSFMFGAVAHGISRDNQRYQATKLMNDKNWFAQWCRREGLSFPDTDMYKRGEIPVQRGAGPWFVKKAVSAAGDKVVFAPAWEDVAAAVAQIDADYQIQAQIKTSTFLNVQYFADDNGLVSHVLTTQQLIAGAAHMGNHYPTTCNPRHVTDRAAQLASDLGLRGIFAFDVAVDASDNMFLLECNPRYNGATYPTAVAMRLGITGPWLATKIKTQTTKDFDISKLDLADLEFNPRTKKGVIITAWGYGPKFGIMLVGSKAQQSYLQAALEERVASVVS